MDPEVKASTAVMTIAAMPPSSSDIVQKSICSGVELQALSVSSTVID